jgi:hypothetical protein
MSFPRPPRSCHQAPFACDAQSTEAIFALLSQFADADGKEGLFGPIVDVLPDAPLLHRAIGLTGRGPSWTPSDPGRPELRRALP